MRRRISAGICGVLLGTGGVGVGPVVDEVQKEFMYASAWLELISGSVSKATAAVSGTVVA